MFKSGFNVFLVLVIFWCVSIAAAAPGPDAVDLSLSTAMAMAIRNNLDLRVDALTSAITDASVQQSRGIYDPLLSLSAGYDETLYTGEKYGTKATTTNVGLTQNLPTGGSLTAFTSTSNTTPLSDPDYDWTDWYSAVGITFVQPLLKNFGKESRELGISLAVNSHEASIEEYRDSVIGTVYDVIRGYNRLYTLQLILKSRETALSSAQKLLTDIKQNDKGEQQSVELANTMYSISRRLKDLVEANKSIRDQEAKLLYLIGVEKRIKLNPVDLPATEEPLETTEQAIALAMENGYNLKQLRLELKSSELQERVSRRNQLPDLSINTSVGFRGIEDRFSDSLQQITEGKGRWWSAGLQISMPLGNTVAENLYRRDKLRTQQTMNRIAAAEWKLRDMIETDMRALMSARIQRQVAEKSVRLSEQRLEQYRKSVARKTSKIQDLLNAENDLVYAGITQAEAIESFSNAVALLWRDAGVLLERKNIHVNIAQPEELSLGTPEFSAPAFTPQDIEILATEIETPVPAIAALPVKNKHKPGVAVPTQTEVQTLSEKPGAAEQSVYTLRIGEYVSSELEENRNKVERAGLVPLVSPGTEQPRKVIRLRAGDFSTLLAAKLKLNKVRSAHAEGFILDRREAGYRLYAGSYFSQQSAQKEQRRLVAAGFVTILEEAEVLLPTSLLEAGRFPNREAALAGALKLRKLGLEVIVHKEG